MSRLSVAVIVPTYKRPDALIRCLHALKAQTVPPVRIVVAVRRDDLVTLEVVQRAQRDCAYLEVAFVKRAGAIAAIQAAVALCEEDIVAHTDDDAVPRNEWIERMMRRYSDDVGGVGGRDVLHVKSLATSMQLADVSRLTKRVGQITWLGRLIGNHHIGIGPSRDVAVLKGVNMSMRRQLWVMDTVLKGDGAQFAWELGVCLRARAAGWRLIYDPAVAVDHYPAPRHAGDSRESPSPRVGREAEWNQCYVVARHAPLRLVGQAAMFQLAVGSRAAPGLLRVSRGPARRSPAGRGGLRLNAAMAAVRINALARGFGERLAARLRGQVRSALSGGRAGRGAVAGPQGAVPGWEDRVEDERGMRARRRRCARLLERGHSS